MAGCSLQPAPSAPSRMASCPSSLACALGALAVGLPTLFGLGPLAANRALLWAYAVMSVVLGIMFTRLSPAVEAGDSPTAHASKARPRFGLHRSRRVAIKLAGLGA